jgi:hypothetical protein
MGLVQIRQHDEKQWTDTPTSLYQIAFKKFYTNTHTHTHTKAMVLAV